PDLNPVEGAWSVMKNSLGNLAPGTTDQLAVAMRHQLDRIQRRPGLINGFLGQTRLTLQPETPSQLRPRQFKLRLARAVPRRDCPGYAGQSRNFRNSAGVKPACRRTGASVPRFTTAWWGQRPRAFPGSGIPRGFPWFVRMRSRPTPGRGLPSALAGRKAQGLTPAPGSRKVVTDGVAVMCPAGSSTSSRYSSTASARFASASSIVCPCRQRQPPGTARWASPLRGAALR